MTRSERTSTVRPSHSSRRLDASHSIAVKRVYEEPAASDGLRVLVDRLWPRGLAKGKAKIDLWLREIAPSDKLRHWYGHDPGRWTEFKRRYFRELAGAGPDLAILRDRIKRGRVTLIFSSKEAELNNAVALAEYLGRRGPTRARSEPAAARGNRLSLTRAPSALPLLVSIKHGVCSVASF